MSPSGDAAVPRGYPERQVLAGPVPRSLETLQPDPQRLRRVFQIAIETSSACGGPVRVIARIEDPDLIETILAHRGESQAPRSILIALRPEPRVPPGPEG